MDLLATCLVVPEGMCKFYNQMYYFYSWRITCFVSYPGCSNCQCSIVNLCFRYTVESSVDFGAPRNTDHPELRQPSALDVWKSIVESLEPGLKITVLTNGPLTNLAQIIDLKNSSLVIQVSIETELL